MKYTSKNIFFTPATMIIYSTLLYSSNAMSQSVPQIFVENKHHDFGKLFQNQKVSHVYEIKNIGEAELEIKDIDTSCGCTFTMMEQKRLQPGETTKLEIQFNPFGLSGAVEKYVTVISNDPNNTNVKLTFTAEIIQEIVPTTQLVTFEDMTRETMSSYNIRLKSEDGLPVTITNVLYNGKEYLKEKHRKLGNDMLVTIEIDASKIPTDKYYGNNEMTILTTNKNTPEIKLTIEWNIQSLVQITPEKIKWICGIGEEKTTTLQLKHTLNKPFKILKAQSSSSLIKINKFSKKSQKEHELEIKLSPKAKPGFLYEIIDLTLDDPEQKKVEIKVVALIEKKEENK